MIGFSSESYSVNECDGKVSITIEVVGSLQREVIVYLSTSDQTAYGDFFWQPMCCDYIIAGQHNIIIIIVSLQLMSTMNAGSTSH